MAALQGLTILLLEDEPLIALDVEQLCLEHGAAAVRLAGALSAIPADGRFDAAILDVTLGTSSTLDFARRLLEDRIPFIFATGMVGGEDLLAAFPGVSVVGKPYAGSAVVDALAQAVHSARSDHRGGA